MTLTLRTIGPEIWVAEQPANVFGIEYGIRMTVLRLANDRLAIISPIALNKGIFSEVEALGKVAYLIAPNSFHHLHIKPWTERYPEAALLIVPHLVKKRPDLVQSIILNHDCLPQPKDDATPLAAFLNEVSAIYIACGRMYEEVIFLHKKSETVILTDLCFNIHRPQKLLAKMALKLYGIYKKFGPSKAVALFIRNKSEIKAAITQLNGWKYQRVVVAHGDIVEHCGQTFVQDALATLT